MRCLLVVVGSLLRFEEAVATCICGVRYPTCDGGFCYNTDALMNSHCWMVGCCNHGLNSPCTAGYDDGPPPSPPAPIAPPPAPPPSTDTCVTAYQNECYNHYPFDGCCQDCNSGSSSFQCDWCFSDRVTICEDCFTDNICDHFTWTNTTEAACESACGVFGRSTNVFLDYCPGGSVYIAAQLCPTARASLARLIPIHWCPHAHGAESCTWRHQQQLSDGSNQTINGDFAFDPGDAQCKQACDRIGNTNNIPAAFCPGGSLNAQLGSCAEAHTSLTNALAQAQAQGWCLDDNTQTGLAAISDLTQRPWSVVKEINLDRSDAGAPRKLTASVDQVCQAAWDHQCYNTSQSPDFGKCCDCSHAGNAHEGCTWNFHATALGSTVTLHGHFDYSPEQQGCHHMCGTLNLATNRPQDFCTPLPAYPLGGGIYSAAHSDCLPAMHSLIEAMQGPDPDSPDHMRNYIARYCQTPEMLASAQHAPLQVPILSMCAGIAVLVAFSAAFVRPRRPNDPHGPTQQLLGTH